MMGNAALSGYIYDKNGWRVMICDYLGGNKVLMAKNNYNFTWVYNISGKRMYAFIGPNANGDVYVYYSNVGSSVSGEDWLRINANTFNFTKAEFNSCFVRIAIAARVAPSDNDPVSPINTLAG